ncbi:T9SS type B sorting domain-containing protein [Flavobacterium gelidilacus]|uniref:T9SS type B sorting domain-containing protein n=1 Tax=Flavobacterium gelidilacus TaxID=206041 RepID=UPI00041CF431|nr:T9SS type B sorting domain-containing protein [Flavobacterium gelidilacus]
MRLSLLIAFIFTNFMFGQLSNKHWLPPLHSRDGVAEDHYLYLSTPNPTPFTVSVKSGNGTPINGSPFTISQGNPQTINIGNGQPSLMFLNQSDVNVVKSDKGLILEATKDFYATFKVRAGNHAEVLVAKGIPGIGTNFRVGSVPQGGNGTIRNFVSSFMATEDNTSVNVSDYNTNVVFTSGSGDITLDTQNFVLNKGESVVLSGYTDFSANYDGFIGALISSDKPIAVSTGNALGGTLSATDGQDFNLDQIVSYEQVGSEYIVVRGNGGDDSEFPIVIATQNNTEIFINGSTTPFTTINTGGYLIVPPTFYQGTNHKNMYITSSKPIYLYQVLAGSGSSATTGMNFIPPLSCFFQKSVDLIPSINSIGNTQYTSDIIALTYASSTVTINGNPTTTTPEAVLGTSDWVTYRIPGFTGNVVVESTGPLAVGVFGASGAAGYGGYYSGFGSEPRDTNVTICSSGTTDLLDAIDGNPETGGVWTPALASGTDIFDPNVDLPGTYNYSYTATCANISVDITVAIQQAPDAGTNNTIEVCSTDPQVDLFSLLGTNVTTGGTWSPAMASGTGLYDPAIDAGVVYTYTIPSDGICEDIFATITVTKNVTPSIVAITAYEICDNNVDGDDANGFVTFSLPTKNAEVLDGQSGITVSYHANQIDADNNSSPLTNYYATTQLVYVRLTNNTTNCFATTSFNLVVNPLPVVTNNVNLKQCDTDTDAITDFNLTFANLLISNDTTLNFTYFTSQLNAQNNIFPITNETNYTSGNNGEVWARVETLANCFRIVKVNLLVSTTTPVTGIPLNACDDYIDLNDPSNDGFDYFDLNIATTGILAQFPPNQNLQVSYYENEADATAGLNPINTATNYRNTVANNQLVWVRIDSAINNECFGLGQFVELTVDPIPNVELGLDFVVCLDAITGAGSQTINATPITAGNYSYNWTPANPTTNSSGDQSAIYTVTQSGIYSVEVTNIDTQCKNMDSVEATFSSEPVSVSAVLITPLFSPGTATIEALPVGGYGIYEYSIDNGINWQPSPIFGGLTNGNYTVLVRDIKQCGVQFSQSIQTVTYPPYFTPNGDGFNEYWNINGLLQSYQGKIFIFDRYGKFLKEISPNGNGWDGTFNGQPLPSTDYWFKIEYTENGNRQEFKSHFTLKR